MDRLGLATEMTRERIQQNAYYCGYDCDTMVNNALVFDPDGKVFFVQLIIRGADWMGPSPLVFSCILRRRLVTIKYVSIRASRGVVMQLGFLSARFLRGVNVDYTQR